MQMRRFCTIGLSGGAQCAFLVIRFSHSQFKITASHKIRGFSRPFLISSEIILQIYAQRSILCVDAHCAHHAHMVRKAIIKRDYKACERNLVPFICFFSALEKSQ